MQQAARLRGAHCSRLSDIMRDFLSLVSPPRPAAGDGPTSSAVYRNKLAKDGFPSIEPTTVYELFELSAGKYGDTACLGHRPKVDGVVGDFEFLTYTKAKAAVKEIADGLKSIGAETGDRIGVYGGNSPSWMLALQACNRMSYVCVPLYDSLGEGAVEYIVKHAATKVVFTSTQNLPKLAKSLPQLAGVVQTVVYWGSGDASTISAAASAGLLFLSIDELAAKGAANPADAVPPNPDTICTIMYTSGTTGDPKGVLLSNRAIIAAVTSLHYYCKQNGVQFNPGEAFLSYLPLAHIFDRVAEEFWLYQGGTIGYWQGDINSLVDDIGALKPHLFVGVPRVFDRIYNRVLGGLQAAGLVKRSLFNWAWRRKWYFLQQGKKSNEASPFCDKLVFNKVKQRLGGRVKIVVSGGAPLAPHVEEFLRVSMCAGVGQGYGLTETGAASFIVAVDDPDGLGTVGYPLVSTEFKLESVPEMDYNALDPDTPKGELLLRGPGLFSGYYQDEAKTKEAIDADGWFHTGDIVALLPVGSIKIIDRKKNIFKLSQGEYVAAEKLEIAYSKSPLVEQMFVYGNSFKSTLVAIVVPSQDALKAWAETAGISGDFASLCQEPKAVEHILAELSSIGKQDKLKGFEMIKAVHLEPNPWTIEDELLTPTFKLKRAPLQKRYQAVIDKLYTKLD